MDRKGIFGETFQLILDDMDGVQDYRVVAVLAGIRIASQNNGSKRQTSLSYTMVDGSGECER